MKEFWKNLKEIIANLPLIASDSQDPKDVSLNRIITIGAAVYIAAAPPIVLKVCPQHWDKMTELWKLALAFLGAQTAGNLFAKISKIKQGGSEV